MAVEYTMRRRIVGRLMRLVTEAEECGHMDERSRLLEEISALTFSNEPLTDAERARMEEWLGRQQAGAL